MDTECKNLKVNYSNQSYLPVKYPADIDPIIVIRSCTKNTQFICFRSEFVWHPRSNRVGPRNATPIPNIPNTKQSTITETLCFLNNSQNDSFSSGSTRPKFESVPIPSVCFFEYCLPGSCSTDPNMLSCEFNKS